MQSPILAALGWIGVYLFLTLFPLLVMLLHPMPQARGFWLEFSVALGFIGLALMVLQFILAARVNRIEASYGVDLLIGFHRYTSILAFVLILVHPIILFIHKPELLGLLNFPQAPLRAQLAMLGTLSFLAMLVTTIWRKQLHIPYEPWRFLHSFLAILAVGLGFGHAIKVGYYLDSFWNRLLWISFALVALWLIIYVRLVKPLMMMKRPYEVESVTPQRGNVCTLALRPIGHAGFEFEPGQFSWLTLEVNPMRMREHPFSMSSSGNCTDRIEFGIKALGDFTEQIKDIKPGTKAYLDGPYGAFTTAKFRDSSGFVLIAGGVGITPIYSMLLTAAERDEERPFLLIYAAKSWNEITFREDLEALKNSINLEIIYVLRKGNNNWQGEIGYVDHKLLEKHIPDRRGSRHYFICASPKMMDVVERALFELDVPVTNIHMEHFNLA